jgi:hypothetical protein
MMKRETGWNSVPIPEKEAIVTLKGKEAVVSLAGKTPVSREKKHPRSPKKNS